MTVAKVVDASAIAALVFAEAEADAIAGRLMDAALVAPTLLAHELANVCVTKMRRDPARHSELLAALALMGELAIDERPVDAVQVAALAQATQLTAYDAAYLWLSRTLGIELVTLDSRLARAAAAAARG
ncbi:type II toxin-antitoxin system VapC family toxin [Acidisphaera rubrifaciens]|uniref:Ribonuclease VapC n=1 Tax=Acidisphaera rubrifaciens HS-AP3 TaxID=1231350 RepID=A0A0D6P6C3_9PROT|nr:type II toxin-antitoxin system VapC family toxin [Acidisphaera rubrifaciens]GAN77207.1 pilus retraction motor hexameric ATPase PilT [Acidisphaera rubrifaciens HS-AP3]